VRSSQNRDFGAPGPVCAQTMINRRRLRLGPVAALALAVPSNSLAAWEVEGRGFGHGVGMSQYGAYGYAQHGAGYREILEHYYSGAKVSGGGDGAGGVGGGGIGSAKAGGKVRVLLGTSGSTVRFSGAGRACGKKVNPRSRYAFVLSGGGVRLQGARGKPSRCGTEAVASAGVNIVGFGRYRGNLVARADDGELQVINSVGVDAYVKGVVPNEMPPSWPQQALRAQAVAARSFALTSSRGGAFDLYADTRSQVYEGRSSETASTNRAVGATAGGVVTYLGKTAQTTYFSTSGGQTEDARYGFGGSSVPYLKSVKDPYDDLSPVHNWRERFSDAEMESKLAGLFGGSLQRIEVAQTGVSPRIVRARVVGSSGSSTVSGSTLQSRLGLRSTWARFDHR
jgi:stage II sporulation protein D